MSVYPNGKTSAQITNNVHQTELSKGDVGYIDGYVQGGDGRPYAVFVRQDGYIDLSPIHCISAI